MADRHEPRFPQPRPPRLVEALLRRVLPDGIAGDAIRGDLRQEYAGIRARLGPMLAGVWFCWESARLVIHLGIGGGIVRALLGDLMYAARGLARQPGFTAMAVLTIGLGLGANTAIFAVLNAVVLRPLPFDAPDEVVALRTAPVNDYSRADAFSYPQFQDFANGQRAFVAIAAFQTQQATWTLDGEAPRRLDVVAATHDLLPLLGVQPSLGRAFAPDDDAVGAAAVVIVSHTFWRGALGGDPAVLSSSLVMDGASRRIVGVLPADFRGETAGGMLPPATADVWLPYLNSPAADGVAFRGLSNVSVVGRLKPGATLDEANADADRIMTGLRTTFAEHTDDTVRALPAHEVVTGAIAPTMFMLVGAALVILLVACTNVMSLLLGRATGRSREVALRVALGAGRVRIARLLLSESVVIAVVGAVVGWLFASGALALVKVNDPGSIPRLASSGLDAASVRFLLFGSCVVAAILALVPLVQARRASADAGHLRDNARGTVGSARILVRRTLVVVQVTAAVVLLMGAGLLLRSFGALAAVDPGFQPAGLLTARIAHPTAWSSPEWPEHVRFFRELVDRAGRLPLVESAAAAYWDPADAGGNNAFRFASRPEPDPGNLPGAIFRPVTPGYFRTAGIPLQRGRDFTNADEANTPAVAIVNEEFVRRYYAGNADDALGDVLDYGSFWDATDGQHTIVGIAADVRFAGPTSGVPPAIYFPHAQQPTREASLLLRTTGDPAALGDDVRRLVADLNPTLPVDPVTTLDDKVAARFADRRLLTILLAAFALTALSLAAIGLYGVLSFVVAQRTREIGVRVALGAERGRVMRQVLGEGLSLVAIGLAIGLPAARGLAGAVEHLMFGVTSGDLVTLTLVPVTLAAAGLIACAVPALRATRVEPIVALRAE